ncbi:MAG: hypothetical protein GY800_03310 [Planctomycetes bacterium]|nr:hypothetical protein [Planctomycetota bacterium]
MGVKRPGGRPLDQGRQESVQVKPWKEKRGSDSRDDCVKTVPAVITVPDDAFFRGLGN